MKEIFRNTTYQALRISGALKIQRALRRACGEGYATVLVFHGVTPDFLEDGVTITPSRFRGILAMLKAAYRVLSVGEFLSVLESRGSFTGREVVITFDDGYLDNFVHAVPVLQEYGLPACFFLTAGFVGTEKTFFWDEDKGRESLLMTWSQARKMGELGFDLGCHSWSHPDLGKEPLSSVQREIYDARNKIADETGQAVNYFAYPFGGSRHITGGWVEEIKNAGFACNFSAVDRHVTAVSDPFRIPRLGAAPQRSVTGLRIDIDHPW